MDNLLVNLTQANLPNLVAQLQAAPSEFDYEYLKYMELSPETPDDKANLIISAMNQVWPVDFSYGRGTFTLEGLPIDQDHYYYISVTSDNFNAEVFWPNLGANQQPRQGIATLLGQSLPAIHIAAGTYGVGDVHISILENYRLPPGNSPAFGNFTEVLNVQFNDVSQAVYLSDPTKYNDPGPGIVSPSDPWNNP